MKKISRLLLSILLLLFTLIIIFFFWASSANYSEKEYSRISIKTSDKNEDKDSIYSIITYNIGYLSGMTNNKAIAKPKNLFDTNLKRVKLLFKEIDADIIAFQEIDYASSRSYNIDQENELSNLGYTYVARAINWDKTYVPFPYWPPSMHFGKVVSGQSILSKYPLSNQQRIVLDRVEESPFYRDALYLDRLAQIVTLLVDDKEIILINVHLEAFDKATRVKQFKQVLGLFKKYAEIHPTILLGDFNSLARDNDAAIQQLFASPTIGNAAFENPIANTYSSVHPFKRIDYIFYSNLSIEYIGGKVLNEFGDISDHLPVEMQFKFK